MVLKKVRANWLRIAVHGGVLLSLAWLGVQLATGAFVVDPIREMTTYTGKAALVLLILSLACTPLVTLTGWKRPSRVRRALGLYAFLYAAVHLAIFVGLDYGFDLEMLVRGIEDQRYVLVGFAAGLGLLALALTSTRGWQRRLGRAWKRLHRLVYVSGILAVVHFLWLVKDPREPLRYAALLALLLVLRIPAVRQATSRLRRRLAQSLRPREKRQTDPMLVGQ
ncbi:MAG: protein-methionine-sulfoxide reductase heme-binding subunit MsrQ [Anaerolineae bacterium]|jgi:sulfoxide reductase heme-binding subunit YedZ